ncbi:putative acyl-CoA transferases/carnitine dehydratase [Pyrobaculum oguniense TE7]|uniref:Acyl-CoA transferases/carnitine dehydratase n=1 Tax=Pyrobaculum oguniense (strain DSM 13380 / JCM 10595 / TE7) TaxID=698757 RepID=H6QDS1_PYROT|nr:putative acyl-CoA transferases/carnitine dehydratase [Pyrobaculum oguniense TE7]
MNYFKYIENVIRQKGGTEPLKGLRVVEVTHFVFGPTIGRYLALLGAEVIKVEPPGEGDRFRQAAIWGRFYKLANPYFLILNVNKYFIATDAREKEGREIIYKLVKDADIFIENLRAGLAESMGIGYFQLSKINPKLIYVSCSGYGQFGPLSRFPSFDVAAQGVAGIARTTGWPEIDEFYKLPDYFGDYLPALIAVAAIMAALIYRKKTGTGQYIDISQTESLLRFHYELTYYSITGKEIGKTGNIDPSASPSGIFKTYDGKYVAIAVLNDEQAKALAEVTGIEELKKPHLERLEPKMIETINEKVGTWIRSKTLEDIISLATTYGFPAAPVLNDVEVTFDKWKWIRGTIEYVNDRLYGRVAVVNIPSVFSSIKPRIKWLGRPVGYHNRLVLKKVGYSNQEIKTLIEKGVVGFWDNIIGAMPPPTWEPEKDPVFQGEKDELDYV